MKNTAKGYTKESIQKFLALCKFYMDMFKAMLAKGMHLKVSFSQGNNKIGRVLNVSILPILSCWFACGCDKFCYDIKACLRFAENVLGARAKNFVLATECRDDFFAQIDEKMSRRKKNKLMRWHVGGEIIDYDYFCRMVESAWKHPDYTAIWTYTKKYSIVNQYIAEHGGAWQVAFPNNFKVMFSEWRGYPIDNPYGLPVFHTIDPTEDAIPEKMWRCPGNCDVCKETHRGCIVGETTYVFIH